MGLLKRFRTLFPYIPPIPRLIVVIATSFSPFLSDDFMKMHENRPTRFSAWTTVYGQSGGIARRTASTSLSYHILYERETFSEIAPLDFFLLPSRTVFAAIFRLSRSISSWKPKAMMSGESVDINTLFRNSLFSGEPDKASGLAASTFHETTRTVKSLKEENDVSCLFSSLSSISY